MRIGKLNLTKWTYDDSELAPLYIIIWKMIWIIPVYIALIIFATLMSVIVFDFNKFREIIDEYI